MPEVTVRKRVGRRSGSVAFKARRWFYYSRTQVAMGLAAFIAAVVALLAWSVLSSAPDDVDLAGEAPVAATD